jgi:hypothetical protein
MWALGPIAARRELGGGERRLADAEQFTALRIRPPPWVDRHSMHQRLVGLVDFNGEPDPGMDRHAAPARWPEPMTGLLPGFSATMPSRPLPESAGY